MPINPYAASSEFGQYLMIKIPEKYLKPCQIGTYLRVLSESYPMNTNVTWFR